MTSSRDGGVPLLARDDHREPSLFRPEKTLRESRRQNKRADVAVPPVCLLDPDGDLVTYVRDVLGAVPSPGWACYHTTMWEWQAVGTRFGVVGHAVGASFAVLCAEQVFASGCELLVSVTSAGELRPLGAAPYHVVIDRARRDEGTSYHYLPASTWAEADAALVAAAERGCAGLAHEVHRGASWTTDAPYRETARAIAGRTQAGAVAVEMEAAALYAFSRATGHPVLCFAHVTNSPERDGADDFEKGAHNGAKASLDVVEGFVAAWLKREAGG